jgi:DNA-binding LacI/PurR family transcriptional regulator
MADQGRPTIRDVAAAAGVSVTTVSHALNEKGRVDAKTRRRVADTAARLGYAPNRAARSLRGGPSQVIALLLPALGAAGEAALSLENYMRMASTVAIRAHARNHAVLLLPATPDRDDLQGAGIDGAIVVDPTTNDPRVGLLEDLGITFVTIERDPGRADLPWHISLDAEAGMEAVVGHLKNEGAERICLLAPDADWAYATNARRAFAEAAARHGIQDSTVLVPVTQLEGAAHQAATRALAASPRPDAVIALVERFAAGVARAAQASELAIPDDLLLVSGADSYQVREAHPPVSALDMQPELCATEALEMLLDRIEGNEPPAPRQIEYPLRIRASSSRSA